MLPQFFDRERELMFLEDVYKERGFKLVVLYGRRRVGKTELLKEFLRKKNGIYFLATDESLKENIKSLKEKFYRLTGKEYFLHVETDSLYELFKLFVKETGHKRCVIAIDEFPYLMVVKRGVLSLFQKIIEELLRDTNVMLILCGSAMSIMESEVLGHRTPLYGREVNTLKLLPFNFLTISRIFKDPFLVYFVFGGTPYYIKFYDESKDLLTNIKTNLLTKGRNLYDEPLILLREEFKESRVYRLLLKYISLGYKSTGKLCSVTGMDKSNIMKYISTMEELGIIKHIVPFGAKRKGIYEIVDPMFRFWFKFIYPYRDLLEIEKVEMVENEIRRNIDSYFGPCFEYLIEELLVHKAIKALNMFDSVHKWWHKDKEIDIVAINEKTKEILFAECKWQNKVNANKIIKELAEKASYVQWHNDERKEIFAIFAKSFSKRINSYEGKPVYCFSLRDLEKMMKR
ncbi:MAG: ATP-binding protein [Candidatus Aenigmatarchaeota archaeon]|nr:MAG: ATP-binding protein [Candidatus Aenigmarchaeota archaeon]